jgi:hypothetical protein
MILLLTHESRVFGLKPTPTGCLFSGPEHPADLSKQDCAWLASRFAAMAEPDAAIYRCEECGCDTPHADSRCLICDSACCSIEDGEFCAFHLEDYAYHAHESAVCRAQESR